jgi:hypothetical protein
MSIHFYPVIKTDICCDDYSVKINGCEVELNTARVSCEPHNRRWPGHQRQIEQTELVNFLSFAIDGVAEFEITPKTPFEKVTIRPKSLGITPEIKDGVIKFTLNKPQYFTVEAYGRSKALHVFADPMPDYNVDFKSDGVIYFGKGEHHAGEIHLESNQTLFIDEGAVVYGIVRAKDAKNVKILGRGILDVSKNKEKILFECEAANNHEALDRIIDDVTDIPLLGSAIYSQWRYFNHWAYNGAEILEPQNRAWFILALSRLVILSEEFVGL